MKKTLFWRSFVAHEKSKIYPLKLIYNKKKSFFYIFPENQNFINTFNWSSYEFIILWIFVEVWENHYFKWQQPIKSMLLV